MGIELVPRDYDVNSPNPFRKEDIVSLVPVHKVVTQTLLVYVIIRVSFFFFESLKFSHFPLDLCFILCSKLFALLQMGDSFWNHLRQLWIRVNLKMLSAMEPR